MEGTEFHPNSFHALKPDFRVAVCEHSNATDSDYRMFRPTFNPIILINLIWE